MAVLLAWCMQNFIVIGRIYYEQAYKVYTRFFIIQRNTHKF